MTRPQIIRADTIDLQDQLSPSAQDHTRKQLQTDNLGHGYHQAAELRHVQHERQAEEMSLTNSWTNVQGLSEEPPSEDEDEIFANGDHMNNHMPHQNGLEHDEDSDGVGEEDDDDGADRISSSPSISDGGCARSWPRRTSSLPVSCSLEFNDEETGASSTLGLFVQNASYSPEQCSPAPECRDTNGGLGKLRVSDKSVCSSKFVISPEHFPLFLSSSFSVSAFGNHPLSEGLHPNVFLDFDESTDNAMEEENEQKEQAMSLRAGRKLEESPSVMDLNELLTSKVDFSEVECHRPNIDYGDSEQLTNDEIDINDLPEDDGDDEWVTDSDDDDASFDSVSFNDDVFNELIAAHDPRYVCTGWSSRSLQLTEDIDFEFVYALHNFVATVEGQANATKGDTMVLLDDSNSYWWLVRIVKDSSIGYLPAEHIETPTERLARLNKHRNIDACKMMYEDTLEKPKNSILLKIKKRAQKAVAFTEPTYRDPPVYEYSSSEEEEDDASEGAEVNGEEQSQSTMETSTDDEDEISTEPAAQVQNRNEPEPEEDERRAMDSSQNDDMEKLDPRVTRNGTIRNTDSFFKDDNVETRKISLTPNLLRDDSGPRIDVIRERASFESDKTDRSKEEKKKEKKGVLSIFKRNKKDKKKTGEADSISSAKSSIEYSRDSPIPSKSISSAKSSTEFARESQITSPNGDAQRPGSSGKLVKAPPQKAQRPITSPNGLRPLQLGQESIQGKLDNGREISPDRRVMEGGPVRSPVEKPGPLQIVKKPAYSEYDQAHERLTDSPVHVSPSEAQPDSEPPALVQDSSSTDSDGVRSLRDSPSPQISSPRMATGLLLTTGHANGLMPGSTDVSPISPTGRGGHSPQMAQGQFPAQPTRAAPTQPPALFSHANGNQQTSSSSPADRTNSVSTTQTMSTLTTAPSPSTIVWSDASLRAYFDDPPLTGTTSASGSPQVGILGSNMGCAAHDVRDLLLLTRDTTGVVPVGPEHPLMKGLFVEERGRAKEVGDMLDGLLGGWLERRSMRLQRQDYGK